MTIQGMVAILRDMGVTVEERHVTYGELSGVGPTEGARRRRSIGTAGIMNRCAKLVLRR